MRVSEFDILNAYEHLVTAACAGISCIEMEDRHQVCRIGLLYAIRTWRVGMIPFEDYGRRCIAAYLKREEQIFRNANRCEARLSLDMFISYDSGNCTTYADFIASYEDDYSIIAVRDFLHQNRHKLAHGGYKALRKEATAYFLA